MSYKVQVTDCTDRKVLIDRETQAPKQYEEIMYRGKLEAFPVIRLPLNIPIYRMQNGRTGVMQLEYVRQEKKSDDFFNKGEENQSAQSVQHAILLEMSKDSKGPIFQELEQVKIQVQPLLITAYGVVVNGNRRLAAMRELYTADPAIYSGFAYVNATVLPEAATEIDIEMIESELQMIPETKLEYGWIERRRKLRKHVEELQIDRAQIKQMYRFKKDSDINKELLQLDLVDEYLEQYLKNPNAYREVEKNHQLFKDLQGALENKSSEHAERARLIAFPIIKESRKLENRAYAFNDAFNKYAERVLEQFAKEMSIELAGLSDTENESMKESDDPLVSIDSGTSDRFEALKPILFDSQKSEDNANRIVGIYENIKQEKKDEDIKYAALRYVEDANRSLHNANLSLSDPLTFPKILAQLETIQSRIQQLEKEISEITTKMGGTGNEPQN